MTMTSYDFYANFVIKAANRNQCLRLGQLFMNELLRANPGLGHAITGTEYDCFYDDSRLAAAVEYVFKNWT